jgi:hypothetical protein
VLKKEASLGTGKNSLIQEKIIISKEQIEKNDIAILQKEPAQVETQPTKIQNPNKQPIKEKRNLPVSIETNPSKQATKVNNDCLQFRSHVGGIHKAEKVLVLDGKFVTIYMGKTLATPVSEFELLESCKINSPFTIATDKIGKVSVKTAIIKGDQMFLETDVGIKIIKVGEVQSMVPDSILEKIRFIVVRRKDGNLHYCNNIEFIGADDVRLNSRSGVSVTKSVNDIEYIQLGDNSTNFVIYKKDKLVIKSVASLVFKNSEIIYQDDAGLSETVDIEDIQRIESE